MENASKALIIAGAILLSILIISLGIMIFNQAKEVVGNDSLNEAQISAHNSKFTQYEGNAVRGANVNALLTAVVSNNQAAINAGESNKLINLDLGNTGITVGTESSDGQTYVKSITKKAQTGRVYKVYIESYGTTGLVKKIKIENSGSDSN